MFSALPLLLALLTGCAGSQDQIRAIDARATAAIGHAATELHGEDRGYAPDAPAEILRGRLCAEQNLPTSHPTACDAWVVMARFTEDGRAAAPPGFMPAGDDPLALRLVDALRVGAQNSQEYQKAKEEVFRAALAIELESHAFRHSLSGLVETLLSVDLGSGNTGSATSASLSVVRRFEAGLELSGRILFDLVKLLSAGRVSALGIVGDATITVPLLRGAGAQTTREPLTQAEHNLLYAIHRFEQYKRTFAVRIAGDYLTVLQAAIERDHAAANSANLDKGADRAARLAEAGRLPVKQVGLAAQNALRARERLLLAENNHGQLLDNFKKSLGLPPDARIVLDDGEFARIAAVAGQRDEKGGQEATGPVSGWLGVTADKAITTALGQRPDLRIAQETLADRERQATVAAGQLEPDLALTVTAALGEERSLATVRADNAAFRPERGSYSAALAFSPGLDRTAEGVACRLALLDVAGAIRDLQQQEDSVKLSVMNAIRALDESSQQVRIQEKAIALAERRVAGAMVLFDAGRAEMRDILDAREDLLTAQNSYTAAKVRYRLAELELQRDMGILTIDPDGLIVETPPGPAERRPDYSPHLTPGGIDN